MTISTRTLARLCERLGTGLRAGVDVVTVWTRESEHGSQKLREEARQVSRQIQNGESMAKALRAAEGYFPPLMCDLVEVGEETGRVDEILFRLSSHYRHQIELRKTFAAIVWWPAFQLIVSVLVIGLLILILGIVDPSGDTTLFGFSGVRGLMQYSCGVLGITATLGVLALAVVRGWGGGVLTRVAMKIPVIGGALEAGALSRLSWTLAAALDAGVDAKKAVRMSFSSTQNELYTEQIDPAVQGIQDGQQFHTAFESTGVFSEEYLMNLQTAELSGTYAESLLRLAEEYQDKFETRTKILAVAAGWVAWAGVAVLLIGTIFYLFYNLYLRHIYDALEGL